MSRDELLKQARPSIALPLSDRKDLQEFQDFVLRPVLKMQNDLLIAYFNGYLSSIKKDLKAFTFTAKKEKIRKIFLEDVGIRRNMTMMVIGMLTTAEMGFYWQHRQQINKRIYDLIQKRLCDQVELIG